MNGMKTASCGRDERKDAHDRYADKVAVGTAALLKVENGRPDSRVRKP